MIKNKEYYEGITSFFENHFRISLWQEEIV